MLLLCPVKNALEPKGKIIPRALESKDMEGTATTVTCSFTHCRLVEEKDMVTVPDWTSHFIRAIPIHSTYIERVFV